MSDTSENETPNVDEQPDGSQEADMGTEDDFDYEGDDSADAAMIEGGIAHVTNLESGPQSFPEGTPRRLAIASYLGVAPDAVEDNGMVYRLANVGQVEALDEPLKDGDVITIYSRSVAKGGFPGGNVRS